MYCNIASCNAILFLEKVAYSVIPLFGVPMQYVVIIVIISHLN